MVYTIINDERLILKDQKIDLEKTWVIPKGAIVNWENVEFKSANGSAILILGSSNTQGGEAEFDDFKAIGLAGPDAQFGGSFEVTNHRIVNCAFLNLGSNEKDINALTFVGINGGEYDKITVKNSGDDGIEIFNSFMEMGAIRIENSADDDFDIDGGSFVVVKELTINGTEDKHHIEISGASKLTVLSFVTKDKEYDILLKDIKSSFSVNDDLAQGFFDQIQSGPGDIQQFNNYNYEEQDDLVDSQPKTQAAIYGVLGLVAGYLLKK